MSDDYHPHTSTADVAGDFRLVVLNAVLRHGVKRRLRAMPISEESVVKRRAQIEALAQKLLGKQSARADITQDHMAGVPVERVQPLAAGDGSRGPASADDSLERTVLYIHGGAFLLCSPRTHRGITVPLARQLSGEVIAVDYRLAPEHCYPAAVDDVLAVYRELLIHKNPRHIALAGDSAGGNLVIALLHAAKAEGLAMPSSAVCLSPWTDLTGASESIRTNISRDALLPGERLHELAMLYLDGAYVRAPTASPVYGDFTGFPPLLIHVGDTEILFDDARRVVERARREGVEAHLRIWPGLPHVFHAFSSHLPVANDALREVAEFMAVQFCRTLSSA